MESMASTLAQAYLPQAEGCLSADGRLVCLLDAIAEPHQWKEIFVDLPLELLVLFIGKLLVDCSKGALVISWDGRGTSGVVS